MKRILVFLLAFCVTLPGWAAFDLKEDTASQEWCFVLYDESDGTIHTGETIANTEVEIYKSGSTTHADKNSGGCPEEVSSGKYCCTFDATDTDTAGTMKVTIVNVGSLVNQYNLHVLTDNWYDSKYGTDELDISVVQWLGTAAATPTTAGVPEVDVTYVEGELVPEGNGTGFMPAVLGANIAHGGGTTTSLELNNSGGSTPAFSATGGTNSEGMYLVGTGTGSGLHALGGVTNGPGAWFEGNGTGTGLLGTGDSGAGSGVGAYFIGYGSSDALRALATNGDAFAVISSTGSPVDYNSTELLAAIEAEATDAIEAAELDHLVAVAAAEDEPADNSLIARLAATEGDWSEYDDTTDSLEAIRVQGDAAWDTADLSGLATTAELAKVPKSDGTATWNATALASIEAEADDAIELNRLDELMVETFAAPVANTLVADLTEDNAGTQRFTTAALINAPSGTGLTALASGDARAGAENDEIDLATAETFANDELIGTVVKLIAGTGAGQNRCITDNDLASDMATVDSAWKTNPDATTDYEIVAGVAGTCPDTSTTAAATIVDAWETQSQADPTGFHVNVKEVNGTAQTANDNSADINLILADTGTDGVVVASLNTNAIGAGDIAAGGIEAGDFASGAIDADAIATAAIGAAEIATSAIGAAEIAANAIAASEIADGAIDAGAIATDAIGALEIAANAIGADELATDAIGAAEIAVAAITAAEAPNLDAAITSRSTLTTSDNIGIDWNNVSNPTTVLDLSATTIATVDTASSIGAGGIGVGDFASGSITADAIAPDAIGASELAADAIGASELAADAIGASEVATNAVGDSEWNVTAADSNMIQIEGHALAGTGTQIADGFEIYFDVAVPSKTMEDVGGGSGQTPIRNNTTAASGHSSTTVVLDASASANDDAYTDYVQIKILGGDCVGQTRTINGYIGSTKVATVAAWAEQGTCLVSAGDLNSISYELVSVPLAGTGATASEVWSAGARTLTEIDEDNTTLDLNATAVGAAASVTGAVGSVTGAVGSVTADVEVGSYDAALDLNATQKASINIQADTALTDYDGPTSTEFEARSLVAASYFDPAADTVANVTTTATLTNEPNVWDDGTRTLTAIDEDETTLDFDGTTVGVATNITQIEGSDATNQIAAAVSTLIIEGAYDLRDVLAIVFARQVGTVTKSGDTYTVKEPSGVTTRITFDVSGTTRNNITVTPP